MAENEGMVSPGETGSETGNNGGDAPNYAGYSTPEELVSAHQNLTSEKTTLEARIKDLQTYQGRSGTEIGNLRQQLATLTGQIEAYKSMPQQPATPQVSPLDTIAAKLQNGEITEAEAIKQAALVASQTVETKLGAQFKTMLSSEIGRLQRDAEWKEYKTNFLKENPGYEEAYKTGKLEPWLSKGIPGQEAWTQFQLQATKQELETLKAQARKAADDAEKKGLEKGIKIEQGKTASSKVLNGKSASFAQNQGKYDLGNPQQRRQAAIDKLNQIRSGVG